MTEVNLITKKGKDVLEIIIEPYPYPVSYKGRYYYRSGSTKQELKGAALDKLGERWSERWSDKLSDKQIEVLRLLLGAENSLHFGWSIFERNKERGVRISNDM